MEEGRGAASLEGRTEGEVDSRHGCLAHYDLTWLRDSSQMPPSYKTGMALGAVVAHTCGPSTREAEAGGPEFKVSLG